VRTGDVRASAQRVGDEGEPTGRARVGPEPCPFSASFAYAKSAARTLERSAQVD